MAVHSASNSADICAQAGRACVRADYSCECGMSTVLCPTVECHSRIARLNTSSARARTGRQRRSRRSTGYEISIAVSTCLVKPLLCRIPSLTRSTTDDMPLASPENSCSAHPKPHKPRGATGDTWPSSASFPEAYLVNLSAASASSLAHCCDDKRG